MSSRGALIVVACGLLLGACSGSEQLDHVGAGIRGGTEAPGDQNVVAVVNFAGGNCSGSLIAPRLVLTARHCVAETGEQEVQVLCGQTRFDAPDSPGAIFVVPRPTITNDSDDYAAVSAIRMPPDLGDDLCGTDVVLLVLAEPLEAIEPLTPRLATPVSAGETYSAVGYGVDSALEERPSGVRKRLDGLEVACSGPACADSEIKDNEWVGSGGPCSGDSGGPALDSEGQVIGVVSRGQIGCRSPVFGDVASRADWLKSEAIAVANAAREAPPGWAPCDEDCAPVVEEDELDSSCALSPRSGASTRGVPFYLLGIVLVARRSSTPKNVSGRRARAR